MKTMLILMVVVCYVCVLGASPAFAQEEIFQPGQLLADLKARLALTEDQIAQLRPIMQEQSEQLKALIDQYKGQGITGLKPLQAELAPLHEDVKAQLASILSDEQQKELQTFYEELQQTLNDTIHNRIITEFAEKLELAEEQVEEILPILRASIEQRRELVEQLREQGRAGWQTFREDYRHVQETTAEQLKSILNSEQLQKLKTYQEELHEKIRQKFFERGKN